MSAFLLFGAIALMADSRPEAKLRFMLSMIDLDYSRFLNRCEVVMVMRSASLGLARAKGKEPPAVDRAYYQSRPLSFDSSAVKAEFQGIEFMLADMGMKIEAARQLTYAAAGRSERSTLSRSRPRRAASRRPQ